MKTYSAVLDALARSIEVSHDGYLPYPTQLEVGSARAAPDRFVLVENDGDNLYPYRIYTRETYAKHFPAPLTSTAKAAMWNGSPCPQAPDTCWTDDATGEHVDAATGVRSPTHPTYADAMRELAADPSTSYWLKTAVRTLDLRDSLDAHNDATALLALQGLRLREHGFLLVDPKYMAPNGPQSFAEVLVDLAFNAGHELGQTGTRINEDSRAVVQTLIAWATEFERAHLGVQWGADDAPDYIETVDGFYITKRGRS